MGRVFLPSNTPHFISKEVDARANKVVGRVIGGVGSKLEQRGKDIAHENIEKVLPKSLSVKAEKFIDPRISKVVRKGENIAKEEASKIKL